MGIGGARSVSEAGRLEASGAGGRRDGSSERVEGRWRIGWLKPFRPSKGDGHRAGVAGASGADQEQRTAGGRGPSWGFGPPGGSASTRRNPAAPQHGQRVTSFPVRRNSVISHVSGSPGAGVWATGAAGVSTSRTVGRRRLRAG